MSKIIDLSHHQDPSKINYDKLSKEIVLAIVRTQYGSQTIDRHYETHHKELRKRGIPTNAYAWVRGINVKDMEVEATDFWNRTKEFAPEVYWLDVEEKSMNDMRAGVKAYVKKLRALGARKVGVYIGHHLYTQFNLDMTDFDAVWIPHYGKNDGTVNSKPSYKCDIHQYTDKGRLPGYNGQLDLNRLVSDKPLSFFTGAEDIKKPAAQPNTQQDVQPIGTASSKYPDGYGVNFYHSPNGQYKGNITKKISYLVYAIKDGHLNLGEDVWVPEESMDYHRFTAESKYNSKYGVNTYNAPNGSFKGRIYAPTPYKVYNRIDGWVDIGSNTWIPEQHMQVNK